MPAAPFSFKFLTGLLFIALWPFAGNLVGQPLAEKAPPARPLPEKPLVFHVELAEDIMPPAWRTMKRAMEEADAAGADVIVLSLDTYGGMVNLADSISQRLLHNKALTLVYIVNNAASAGALISLSCDSIYMAPSAQIGAATVVDGTSGEAMPDKYQAYMRAKMRSIAEAGGRDPDIAEAMVDQDIEIPGLIEAGKTLVFTSQEAVANGYCEGIAERWQDILPMAGITDYTLASYQPTTVDRMIKFLVNPVVSGLLLMVIFLGIYAEMQSPGIGFALLAAAIGAVLYFAPHYLDGLAAHWEIALFVVGLIFIGLEVFVFPGFGLSGVAGIGLITTSLVLSMLGNDWFDFRYEAAQNVVRSVLVVVIALLGSIGLAITLLGSLTASPLLRNLVLSESQDKARGFTVDSYPTRAELAGRQGTAATELRPSGKVDLDETRYDAMTQGEFIARGAAVEVVAVKGNYLMVRAV